MNRTRTLEIVSLVLLFLLATPNLFAKLQELVYRGSEEKSMGLVLELKTDKQVYRLDQPVLVTVTLRNAGNETLLLSPALTTRLADPVSIGTVYLVVTDARKKPLPRRLLHSLVVRRKDIPLYQVILLDRSEFRPGDSRTIVRPLKEFGFKIDKPGSYRMRARYYEQSFRDSSTKEEFEEAKKKVPHPWWAEVESEWVWIEIVE